MTTTRRPLSRSSKLGLLVVSTTVASVLSVAFVGGSTLATGAPVLVRWDSHRLTPAPDAVGGTPTGFGASTAAAQTVQLVEFVDFECSRCRGAHPFVEQLRRDYAGQVDFVVRYFPLPGHVSSTHAAIAVEAAAQQGAFEEMADVLWDTHGHWGGSREPQSDLFRAFAADLGLDLAAYDAAVADPATEARVRKDFEDGVALGVAGTPTYFLDGELVRPLDEAHFRALLDEAIAAKAAG